MLGSSCWVGPPSDGPVASDGGHPLRRLLANLWIPWRTAYKNPPTDAGWRDLRWEASLLSRSARFSSSGNMLAAISKRCGWAARLLGGDARASTRDGLGSSPGILGDDLDRVVDAHRHRSAGRFDRFLGQSTGVGMQPL